MKVLHVGAGNLFGGIETLLVTMARERRLCPDLKPHFSVCFEDRFSRDLRATGAPVDYMGNVKIRNPFTILRARAAMDRLLQQEKIDVAICHSSWSHAVFAPVIQSHRTPLVFWSHGFVTGRHWLEMWARRTEPAVAICNSRATEAAIKTMFPQTPSQVIYYPVSTLVPPRARDTESRRVVIIQVSRMEKWKGQTILLEALGELQRQKEDLPDWVCWFVGGAQTKRESGYEESLYRTARALNLGDRVQFLGDRDDVPDLLPEADIFCQPNLSPEPFGIVFVEALQARLPVVSSKMGGALEIVDETCGMLTLPGDATDLAKALRHLIVDRDSRLRLGAAGPARAQLLCDPARQLSKLREVLQALF